MSSPPDLTNLRRHVLALLIDVADTPRHDAVRVAAMLAEPAIASGTASVQVRLTRTGNGACLRIEIDDPHPLPSYAPDDLRLLDRLTTGHGVTHHSGRPVIWAEVALVPIGHRASDVHRPPNL